MPEAPAAPPVRSSSAKAPVRDDADDDFGAMLLDDEANAGTRGSKAGRITKDGSTPEAWVIPTDEELMIARDTFRVVHGIATPY